MPAKTVIIIAAPARRDTIKQLLLADRQFDLLGELTTATSLHLIAQLGPDIVILDCATPAINPLVVLPELRANTPVPQIIALGANSTAAERSFLRALGAAAYATLDQPGSLAEALAALRPGRGTSALARRLAGRPARSAATLAQRHSRHA